jgi:NADH-ubiquinone oxidoreductase chain 5
MPISALAHSSTVVTTGVSLLIHFSPALSDWLCVFLLLFSGLTIFMADLGANFEYDLRKIIAFSTLRQLGLIIGAVSIGFVGLDFFPVVDSCFKALLFMCAGVIIHTRRDSQDIRFMGNLSFQIPFTSVCFGVSSSALCGMPFLAEFYSKDLIVEMVSFSYVNLVRVFLFFALLFLSPVLLCFFAGILTFFFWFNGRRCFWR